MTKPAPLPKASSSWRSRILGLLSWLAIVYLCIAGLLAFVAPDFVRHQLQQQLSTGSFTASIEKLTINPLTLAVVVDGLILAQGGGDKLLEFDQLRVNVSLESVVYRALSFDELALVAPHIVLQLNQQQQLNWLQYSEQLQAKFASGEQQTAAAASAEEDAALPRLLVRELALQQIDIRFIDLSKTEPFEAEFGPTTIAISNLSTLPAQPGSYSISASTPNTELIAWNGDIHLNPVRSSGSLAVSGWRLPQVWRYFKDQLNFEVAEGRAGLSAHYHYDGNLTLNEAMLKFENIRVLDASPEKTELIAVPLLQLSGMAFDLDRQRADITDIELRGLRVQEVIDSRGNSLLASSFTPVPTETAGSASAGSVASAGSPAAVTPATEAGADTGFSLGLKQFALHDGLIALRHELDGNANGAFQLDAVNLTLNGFAWPQGDIESLALHSQINESARLSITGSGDINPLQADVVLELSDFALADLMPYIEPLLAIDLQRGSVSAQFDAALAQTDASLSSRAEGGVQVKDLLLEDAAKNTKLLSFEALNLQGIAWDSEQPQLQIAQLELLQPFAKVVVFKDGSTNVSRLVVEQPQAETQDAAAQASAAADSVEPGKPVSIDIEAVTIHEGTADFADYSLPRAFKTAIFGIDGSIQGISSSASAAATVDITGAVDKYAPVTLKGKVKPLSEKLLVDLDLAFRNMELTAVSPYSDTYAGYNIDKGKLNADFKYLIDGTTLQAENSLIIDQLTLGERTESATATSLPVTLAVALLKDKDGVIDLNLPVSGELDDPQFSYGALIGKALLNLITKIVTSPFAMLGQLVGGGEDMDYVPFAAGAASFSAAEASKLNQLAQALGERPQLAVSIRGISVPAVDGEALQHARLTATLEEAGVAVPVADVDGWESVFKLYQQTTGTSERQLLKQLQQESDLDADAAEQKSRQQAWQTLLAAQPLSDGDFEDLARARSSQVRETLVAAGVAADRLFILDPTTSSDPKAKPHCQLELDAS